VLVGLAALYYHVSFFGSLGRWFGPGGLLPIEIVQQLYGPAAWRISPLLWTDSPTALWVFQLAGFVVLAALAVGICCRVTSVLALLVVLSYAHRAPLLIGAFEPVLSMLLLYLCLAPSGEYLSVDRWWRARRGSLPDRLPSVAANVSLRLIQVHLAGFYVLMGLSMLAAQAWWKGEALWWLIARTETRLVDLTWLHQHPFAINLWTHATVTLTLVFGVLVWNRLARPLLLGLTVVFWVPLALVTGLLAFFTLLVIADVAFLDPETLRRWLAAVRKPSGEPAQKSA
jgi:hypothetical protein